MRLMPAPRLRALTEYSVRRVSDKSTAVGAGVGDVGVAVLTGGSTIGAICGAALGGIIGHEVGD